ncbi:sigma-54-dependent transcriptional regulator [Nitratidesulfovibrio vulgaris]|uniref:sigma-54-dependent transcriptional regulator n=1 Tax=Nitratidesulfovibrio vulgaris TaxID=881 RepID=UPI0022FFDA14|nr:sigma-54 dependent transcriptional regulator [Nitratidesulfovibrio vulgaris]WCB46190.1 sigma-54 dependent transcriptional regulator [Nitratidesulfovibrio vulgaris]
MAHVLVIDGDPAFAQLVADFAAGLGHTSRHAPTLAEGLLAATEADVIYLAASLPDGCGLEALAGLRALPSAPEVIVTGAAGNPDTAEKAIRGGAWEWLCKPAPVDRVVLPLLRALDYRDRPPDRRGPSILKHAIVGSSRGLRRCLDDVAEAAASDAATLIVGETGVGKELFARAVHENSHRADSPFITVDCASLPRTLAGSILFGHRKGAFTGADANRDGLVLQAHRGTLFLDEVGELPLATQKMFLRVLQEQRFRAVGGRSEITSDFRLICATNRNLEAMSDKGLFRSDLLFRMRTVVISIPPLRERPDDILALTGHYLARICKKYGLPAKQVSPDLHEALRAYRWPGNVRELVHTLERAVLAAQDAPKLFARHLPEHVRVSIARGMSGQRPALVSGTGPAQRPAAPGGFGQVTETSRAVTATHDAHALAAMTPLARRLDTAPAAPDNNRQSPLQEATPPVSPGGTTDVSPDGHPPVRLRTTPLSDGPTAGFASDVPLPPFFAFRDALCVDYLNELMRRCNGDTVEACTLSGLSRSHLYEMLRRYGFETPRRKRTQRARS